MRIKKRVLVPERLRRIPRTGFSWIDRQFVRKHVARLSGDAILLYLFLVAVSDKDGLSYYGDDSLSISLQLTKRKLLDARDALVGDDLIAYEPPLYQVLSLPLPRPRHGDGPTLLRDIFRRIAEDPDASSRSKQ